MRPATAVSISGTATRQRLADYLALAKPRVVVMVLATTLVGYHLAAGSAGALHLFEALVGTALAAGGTMALNQVLERDLDARMVRTQQRPLPDGRLTTAEGTAFGAVALVAGLAYLALRATPACAAVTALIAVTYLGLYTPLKRVTPLSTLVGAVAGALPPVAGWAAARGTLGAEPLILFTIMFLWQIPHTLAIGRLYRDDYARAGIRVLPVVDEDATGRLAVVYATALLPVACVPTIIGLAGGAYFAAALVLGLAYLASTLRMARTRSLADARRLLFTSLVHLPALFAVMTLDRF